MVGGAIVSFFAVHRCLSGNINTDDGFVFCSLQKMLLQKLSQRALSFSHAKIACWYYHTMANNTHLTKKAIGNAKSNTIRI